MGFRRRETQPNPWLVGLQNALAAGANFFATKDAEQVALGNQIKEQAAAERAAALQAISDPNSGLTPQQRQQLEGVVTGLGNVATADPRQAAEIYNGLQANVTRTRQVEKSTTVPGNHPITNPVQAGPTRKVNETYTDTMGPTDALSFLMNKSAVGNQKYTEEQYQRQRRDARADARYETDYSTEAQLRVQNDAQADARNVRRADRNFEASQTQTQIGAAQDTAILGANMEAFNDARAVLTDPAATPQMKAKAQRDIQRMRQNNPELADMVIGPVITDERAVAAADAEYKTPQAQLEAIRVGTQQGKQDLVRGEVEMAMTQYQFGQQKLTDSLDLASRATQAATVGDVGTLKSIKNVLQNPNLYPEQAEQLQRAGYTVGGINEDINLARAVRSDVKNDLKFRNAERDAMRKQFADADELRTIELATNYATSFETKADFDAYMGKSANRNKFTPEVLNLLEANVAKNDSIYGTNKAAEEVRIMLEGAPPADPDLWAANFARVANKAQMSAGAIENIATQALRGWQMEGEEFDSRMLVSDMEVDLLTENVAQARIASQYAPAMAEADLAGARASTRAAEAGATATEVDNQTRPARNRADLAAVRESRAAAAAQRRVAELEASFVPGNAEAERKLTEARAEASRAQGRAADALAAQRSGEGTGAGVDPQVLNAALRAKESEAELIVTSGGQQGCFAPAPLGDPTAQQIAAAFGSGPGENADSPVCKNLMRDLNLVQGQISRLGDSVTENMLTNNPVQVNGKQTYLSLAAFDTLEQLRSVVQEQTFAATGGAQVGGAGNLDAETVAAMPAEEVNRLRRRETDLTRQLMSQLGQGATLDDVIRIMTQFQ